MEGGNAHAPAAPPPPLPVVDDVPPVPDDDPPTPLAVAWCVEPPQAPSRAPHADAERKRRAGFEIGRTTRPPASGRDLRRRWHGGSRITRADFQEHRAASPVDDSGMARIDSILALVDRQGANELRLG